MARRPSVMKHDFAAIPKANISRSSFNRNHGVKTTFDAGYLVPVFVDEALPGDTFNMRATLFGRLATPLHPFMDNLRLTCFWFAVPKRLVWDNWVKMMGEQDKPGDSTDYLVPQQIADGTTGHGELSVADYFGIPTKVPGLSHSTLPFRALALIWNEWFRDQNLQDPIEFPTDDGPDDPTLYPMLRRGKRHDYFSSSLPFAQKGPTVMLPIGDRAPIRGIGTKSMTPEQTGGASVFEGDRQTSYNNFQQSDGVNIVMDLGSPVGQFPAVYADLEDATAATINQFRSAYMIQLMYERDARGGTRYTEMVRAHFNVISPDARLQRPEFLGSGVTDVNVNPVAQNSASDPTDATTPQGNLAGYGVASMGCGFTKSFTEHSIIIGLVSLQADLNYQQGLERMWSRRTRFDFFFPTLQGLGEQAVLNKEIYAQGTAEDDDVFGYQERYAEYRYKPSQITGLFRSNADQSLDTWHLAQVFDQLPVLNEEFIEDKPPIDRVTAVTDEPDMIFDMYCQLRCARPMPMYGVPASLGRF